eukprot:CAMPEP_0181215610 /NCGR_PEP_ID=MMETSP1096-20121128/26107_1 /TAXON_ID=156174 ORGANISM="Chrysochromulina ericina, Strain CCMP281" /NCGR_SAMPLE_ID=MMETSP1096 /ASSEMBLY_ACC=CAM_ASM_000453 /LENGTH=461 /DNA_ID=CAMNT_0023307481 /DNA_START=279 /DNA_END=1664 /DNA_ORIENTATION=+
MTGMKYIESVWLAAEVCLWVDQIDQFVTSSRNRIVDMDPMKGTQIVGNVLLVIAFVVRLAQFVGIPMMKGFGQTEDNFSHAKSAYKLFAVLLCFKSIMSLVELLRYFSANERIGVLIITLRKMVDDVKLFMTLFAVITLGFSICLSGLQITGHMTPPNSGEFDPFGSEGAMWAPWWALFGYFEPGNYDWLVSGLSWTYMLVGQVVLVNLLIAMFSDTFNSVKDKSAEEYVHLKCGRVFQYRYIVRSTPPVLNTPIILCEWLWNGLQQCRKLWASLGCSEGHLQYNQHQTRQRMGSLHHRKPSMWSSTAALKRERSSRRSVQVADRHRNAMLAMGDSTEAGALDGADGVGESSNASMTGGEVISQGMNNAKVNDGKFLVEQLLKAQARKEKETLHAVASASRDLITELRLRHIDDSEAVTNRIDMVNSKVDQMQEKFDTTMNTVSLNLQALVEACGVGSTRV